MKKLHRLMRDGRRTGMRSSIVGADGAMAKRDPDNLLLGRTNSRPLDSRRRSATACCTLPGCSIDAGRPEIDQRQAEAAASFYYRALAREDDAVLDGVRRSEPDGVLPPHESVVPQQALALSNSKLSSDCAADGDLRKQLGSGRPTAFVAAAFETILSREPTDEETALRASISRTPQAGVLLEQRQPTQTSAGSLRPRAA